MKQRVQRNSRLVRASWMFLLRYRMLLLYPLLSGLTMEADGLRCGDLETRAADLGPREVEQAIRFVLVEFLTVLGNLTAEVLTPALHAELSKLESEAVEEAQS